MLVLVFFVASSFLFFGIRSLEGDPVNLRLKNPNPERIQEIKSHLGLDKPLIQQYGLYLYNFLRGQWRNSLITGRTVTSELREFLPASLELTICALFLGLITGTTLTLLSFWFDWPRLKQLCRGMGALGLTIPIFWIGIILILIFAVWLKLLPAGSRFDYSLTPPDGSGFLLLDSIWQGRFNLIPSILAHLALPVITLSLFVTAMVSSVLYARLEDPELVLLVRALKAKGLKKHQIWLKHILRLLGTPLIILLGTQMGSLLGGAVLTETVFSWPGMGRYLVEAVINRDLFVVENCLLLIILIAFSSIALTDFIAHAINPTIRASQDLTKLS